MTPLELSALLDEAASLFSDTQEFVEDGYVKSRMIRFSAKLANAARELRQHSTIRDDFERESG